jgi:rubrerythrin
MIYAIIVNAKGMDMIKERFEPVPQEDTEHLFKIADLYGHTPVYEYPDLGEDCKIAHTKEEFDEIVKNICLKKQKKEGDLKREIGHGS